MTELSPELDLKLRTALEEICTIAGISDADAELIKYTNNAVYRLKSEGVVVRIGIGELGHNRARHVASVARWLLDQGAPVVKLTGTAAQPVVSGEYAATIWEALPPADPAWTGKELAGPLRELHELTPPDFFPVWDPFSSARHRLSVADGLGADDINWLKAAWNTEEEKYRSLYPNLEIGLVHGDAYLGNLLREPNGRFVFCDFDGTSRGPIEYDLVVAAVSALRFGAEKDHSDLVGSYGRDVTQSESWPVLRRIRELILVTSVIPDLKRRPDIAGIHAHRLATLRSGADQLWTRYT